MNFSLIRYIASEISRSRTNSRFLNFARLVAVISVALGTMALIISLSVLGGFDKMLRDNAVKFTSHISVTTFNRKPIAKYEGTIDSLKRDFKSITAVAPIISREGLISSKDFIEGIMIRGYSSKYDITNLKANIKQGNFGFSADDAKEIVIGRRLADKLNVGIGTSIVLYAMTETQMATMSFPDINKFKIVGIYETSMAKYDDIAVFIPFRTASRIFRLPENTATGLEILLDDIEKAKTQTDIIQTYLGYPFFCLSVFDTHSSIFAWIDLQKKPIPIVLGLISIVAIFNIITILLITVVEKTYSIGILRALGMPRKNIVLLFIIQGTALGIAGTFAGSFISLALCLAQDWFHIVRLQGNIYFLDTLPILISPWHYLMIGLVSIFLSFISTLIPALIATKINPIKAIRYK